MFSALVLDHVNRPRNVGPLATATHTGVAGVPGDGPYMILELEIAGDRIERAAYQTYGCPSAIACGSVTAQVVTGRTVEQARRLNAEDVARLLGGLPEGKGDCADRVILALTRALEGETQR